MHKATQFISKVAFYPESVKLYFDIRRISCKERMVDLRSCLPLVEGNYKLINWIGSIYTNMVTHVR